MTLRWYRRYYYEAAEGSWARDWPRNAVLKHKDVLQFRNPATDEWEAVPLVEGEEPERPK